MRRVFNKSSVYGLIFAVSSFWLYYLMFLLAPLSYIELISEIIVGIICFVFPIHYAVISIPAYFLLRRRAENKTVFTAAGMFLSIIFEIPLYVLAELLMPDSGVVGNFGRAFVLLYLFLVIIVTFVICAADIIIRMIKQRIFSLPRILSVVTSGILIVGIILIINEIENGIIF